jgi:hypothetical protein
MKAAVVVFPGINRERDMARALRLVSGKEPAMVWHADTALPAGTDLVVIPGGFSYGDYLRCGAIAARAPIMDAVRAVAQKGGLVGRSPRARRSWTRCGPSRKRAGSCSRSATAFRLPVSLACCRAC